MCLFKKKKMRKKAQGRIFLMLKKKEREGTL